jgi:hypothetical protein
MTASAKPGFAPTKETYIAGFTLVAIALHVELKYALQFPALTYNLPLLPRCSLAAFRWCSS